MPYAQVGDIKLYYEVCQRPSGSPHWRPRELPADGRGMSPRTATGCPQGRPRELPAGGQFLRGV
jgi:hypothetical protein